MINFHFDMETADPDDIFSLALLCTHPKSKLRSVTVHPGGKDQVGLVKSILNILNIDIPVGAGTPKKEASRVSSFYIKLIGKIEDKLPDDTAVNVIVNTLKMYPDTHLVTGAALTNIAAAYKQGFHFSEWTCQGGFAGYNIVDPIDILDKFKDKLECQTYNLGGDVNAAEMLLFDIRSRIQVRKLVSKNVCHGVFYTKDVDDRIPYGKHAGLDFIKNGMQIYFKKHHEGKALHDLIAAVVAIKPSIAKFVPVRMYKTVKNEFGCHSMNDYQDYCYPEPNPVQIITKLDVKEFEKSLY